MDAVSYAHSAKQAQRIEKFIENPDSNSGVLTQPKVIEAGETVTIKSGRQAILANTVIDGDLVIEAGADVFVPAGAGFSDLDQRIDTLDNTTVKLKSTNITVNAGTGQTYTTINQALEYLSGFYPMYKKSGITAYINLKSGFVMAEQVLVSGIDLGWITIVGEDAETIITHTALTSSFYDIYYPAFGVDKAGTSPIIGQLFRFNVEKVGGQKHGLMTIGAGSSAYVLSGRGFIGAGANGIHAANGSTITAAYANFSNAGSAGMLAETGSTITAHFTNCSNAGTYGISAETCSTINAYGSTIQNQTTGTARIRVTAGSTVEATGINTTGGTVAVFSQAVNTLTGSGIIYQ